MPWHVAHCTALARPTAISADQAGAVSDSAAKVRKHWLATAITQLLPFIRDPVNGADIVVRHQQRTIGQHGYIDRAAQILVIGAKPSFGEYLGRVGGAVFLQAGEHNTRANRRSAIPGPVLSRKD